MMELLKLAKFSEIWILPIFKKIKDFKVKYNYSHEGSRIDEIEPDTRYFVIFYDFKKVLDLKFNIDLKKLLDEFLYIVAKSFDEMLTIVGGIRYGEYTNLTNLADVVEFSESMINKILKSSQNTIDQVCRVEPNYFIREIATICSRLLDGGSFFGINV